MTSEMQPQSTRDNEPQHRRRGPSQPRWTIRLLLPAVLLIVTGSTLANTPGDMNGDGLVDGDDASLFITALLDPPAAPELIERGDLSNDGQLDSADVPLFVSALLGRGACCTMSGCVSDITATDCDALSGTFLGAGVNCPVGTCISANLTAYRPRHGSGYFPFARTAVTNADESDATRGPGIRLNLPGDADLAGEDDLIEVTINAAPSTAHFVLSRDNSAIRVWTTADKQPGTLIPFNAGETRVLSLASNGTLTLYVEWASASHGIGTLSLQTPGGPTLDTLTFHTFRAMIVALGGEGQPPVQPPDANIGTFTAAIRLYNRGYDVFQYDEDEVSSNGSGSVYNAVTNAIMTRGVSDIAIFGYSHGGGSTYDLAERLDLNRLSIGTFNIRYTSYVDSVSNNSDIDTGMELRRPPTTGYHLNHYQEGSLFQNLGLDGGPVINSNPPPTGLNIETTPWGNGATHFQVDDFIQVLDAIEISLSGNINP